jgi:hypothetical protein
MVLAQALTWTCWISAIHALGGHQALHRPKARKQENLPGQSNSAKDTEIDGTNSMFYWKQST